MQTSSLAADEVGKRIVARRRVVEFTQERLAEKAGQDLLTIRRAEHGATDLRLSTLVAIAGALGMDPGELVTGLTAEMVPVRQPRSENRRRLKAERSQHPDAERGA
ncbi:helix-turn-helix domain-containing protein [uncultured Amnibacterium sp.]|uniref:helix-turn-helix domain-containing protein n=1 Tax=uncultured Amnibacterium sp. TaxID=1631851 RepID=UPI0035CB77EC